MKYFKILLQLHSIKLILFFALAVLFFAMTAANSSNKTKAAQADMSIADEEANSLAVVNSGN